MSFINISCSVGYFSNFVLKVHSRMLRNVLSELKWWFSIFRLKLRSMIYEYFYSFMIPREFSLPLVRSLTFSARLTLRLLKLKKNFWHVARNFHRLSRGEFRITFLIFFFFFGSGNQNSWSGRGWNMNYFGIISLSSVVWAGYALNLDEKDFFEQKD